MGHLFMLRTTLNINNNINIANYPKLITLLKRRSDGFRSKKSKILSTEQIHKFLKDAPDEKHLLSKVILIIGLSGDCRKQELRNIKMEHIQDTGKYLVIDIPDSKTKTRRSFVVPDTFYTICQKYMNLRPSEMQLPLFVNYRNEKCMKQVVGINTIGSTPRKIAEYLQLPEPKQYTGHCFRRSSATILVDAGGDMLSLKRLGGWQSSTVAEGYVNHSHKNISDNALRISEAINYQSSSSAVPTTIIDNRSSPLSNKAQTTYNNCSIVINNYYNKV